MTGIDAADPVTAPIDSNIREKPMDFTGKTVLVTGAARGIGRATATAFAEAGANLVVTDLSHQVDGLTYATAKSSDLEETAQLVSDLGAQVLTVSCDVRDIDGMRSVADQAVARFGRIDSVVANAGVASWPEATWKATDEQWNTMIDVTLTGAWNTCRATIPHLIDGDRGGAIIIVSSSSALKPVATIGHYAAAKLGLVGLMKSLALELAGESIRVNTVHPGGTGTPMTENEEAERWQATAPGVSETLELPMPVHRMEPSDIAKNIRWLCSNEARYVTGTTSLVDAGALLR